MSLVTVTLLSSFEENGFVDPRVVVVDFERQAIMVRNGYSIGNQYRFPLHFLDAIIKTFSLPVEFCAPGEKSCCNEKNSPYLNVWALSDGLFAEDLAEGLGV